MTPWSGYDCPDSCISRHHNDGAEYVDTQPHASRSWGSRRESMALCVCDIDHCGATLTVVSVDEDRV